MEILKCNYEKEKEIEINYRKEIFSIVKDDIYMQNIVGPKPTYSSKNDIKFCIKELYNMCKELDIFMKNNNLKNRSEFINNIQNNRLTLEKYKNVNIINSQNELSDRDINNVINSVENIILEEEKQIKTNNIIYDFDNMKIQDLKLFCKTNNINNYSKLRKKDLINKIKLELKKKIKNTLIGD
jgi:hypothetical protein